MVGTARRAVRGCFWPERSPRRGDPAFPLPPSLTHYKKFIHPLDNFDTKLYDPPQTMWHTPDNIRSRELEPPFPKRRSQNPCLEFAPGLHDRITLGRPANHVQTSLFSPRNSWQTIPNSVFPNSELVGVIM